MDLQFTLQSMKQSNHNFNQNLLEQIQQLYIIQDQNLHQRKAGDIVRFRGPPVVTSAGAGGADEADQRNLQAFINIPTFDNVSDLNNANGFTIALGQIDSAGNVTGATTTDVLTTPINYFYITSTSNATSGNIQGGGDNCSAGPVTLEVVNG